MADGGGGQKPIRNSLLLSAATTSTNFFEEAALLVPVPLVEEEEQAPATAEIDLNSDDSSSNRGSVEKDFENNVTIMDGANGSPPEEPAAPISLFSRAATGVDAFSKMLSGAATSKPPQPPPAQYVPKQIEEPVITLMASTQAPVQHSEQLIVTSTTPRPAETSPEVSTVNLFGGPPINYTPSSTWPSESTLRGQALPTSLLFSAGQDFPVSSSVSVVPSGMSPASSVFGPDSSKFEVLPTSQLPSNAAVMSPLSGSEGGIPLSQKPAVGQFTTSPLMMSPPNPASVPTPPTASNTSNAFRLGSQRMKYVPCPEMSSVKSPTSAPAIPPSMPPTVPTVSPTVPTFMPSYPPAPQIFPTVPSYPPAPQTFPTVPSYPPAPQTFPTVPSYDSKQSTLPPQYTPFTAFPPAPPPTLVPSVATTSIFEHPAMTRTSSVVQPTAYYPSAGVPQYGPQELAPLTFHWFSRKDVDGKVVWKPFSIIDSVALEDSFVNDPERLVPTDGGRYDVCVQKRVKMPVYWDEAPVEVRRGSWFYKGPMDNRFIPYDEEFSSKLEKEYADCMRSGTWQKRLEFPGGESVILHSAGVVVHFCQAAAPDDWGNLPESQIRPRVVKRGVDEIEVEDGESTQVDHLVFVVHGIGPICDFKLRNIVEAVDDFRGLSIQLIHSHFRESIEKSLVGRVEFLPVSWHKALHGDKGIDEQLKRITLRSIPKFRDFTNDTLLDILFYTSPVYCQTIMDSVSSELNRIYKLFLTRNPTFHGKVSLIGHSLGSLILFDLLAHQPQVGSKGTDAGSVVEGKAFELNAQELKTEVPPASASSRTVSYTVGNAGTGQPFITYPSLDFSPTAFFALGSPISMFVTVRGIEKLGNDFRFPTCASFFNIFHPYDPVAYRIETLIDPDFQNRPVLIPHHKGRKRIHLELKETMARVGADIKQRVMDAVKMTWNTVSSFSGLTKTPDTVDSDVQTAIAAELEKKAEADGAEAENSDIRIGSLNGGRRIDHVLQEAPYETFNEYVFAMSTHVGYWESEDTMLLILSETYGSLGINQDQILTGAQNVVSPTQLHGIAATISNTMPFPTTSSSIYSTAYHPSAPPFVDYQSLGQQSGSPMALYGTPVAPPSSVQTILAPSLIPIPTQSDLGLLPPSPVSGQSPRPSVIGNRPVAEPSFYPRGMDPTAPICLSMPKIPPPPTTGFVRK